MGKKRLSVITTGPSFEFRRGWRERSRGMNESREEKKLALKLGKKALP